MDAGAGSVPDPSSAVSTTDPMSPEFIASNARPDRRFRPRERGGAVLAFAGAALLGATACLPDLTYEQAAVVEDRPLGCGNGVIELAATGGETCDPGEATTPGCGSDCQVSCPDGVLSPVTHHCYFAVPAVTNYQAALASCTTRGAHLVTFGGDEERSFVAQLSAPQSAGWVGLTPAGEGTWRAAREVEPGWTSTCPGCFARLPLNAAWAGRQCLQDAPSWSSYQPVDCVSSGAPLAVVCEREPPGTTADFCAGGICLVAPETVGRKRYLYVPVPVTGDLARDACRSLGGQLAMPDSVREREAVLTAIQRFVAAPDERAWIGLVRDGDDATSAWRWDDGQAVGSRPTPWGDGEPAPLAGDVRAVVAVPSFAGGASTPLDVQLARAASAGENHPYVCQYPP